MERLSGGMKLIYRFDAEPPEPWKEHCSVSRTTRSTSHFPREAVQQQETKAFVNWIAR